MEEKKIYLVTWESNVDGDKETFIYACATEEIAKEKFKQCKEKVLSEGHFANITDENIDDFDITEYDTIYFINDEHDDYWEDIQITSMPIIDELPMPTKMQRVVNEYKDAYLTFRNKIKSVLKYDERAIIPTSDEKFYHAEYDTGDGYIPSEVSAVRVKYEETSEHFEFFAETIDNQVQKVWCAEFEFPPHEVEEMLQRIIWE